MKSKIQISLLTIFFTCLIWMQNANAQKGKWGAGIRLGDPTGISLKKYGAKTALEFNIGRSFYLYKHSYENAFYRYDKFDDKNIFYYDKYHARTPISMQLHILRQKNIPSVKGLDWYIGLGPQLRIEKVEYFYHKKDYFGPDKNDYRWVDADEVYTDIDAGIDGVIGLEYTFDDIPLSIAADATLFMEIFDDPFFPWGQMGMAVRYNF